MNKIKGLAICALVLIIASSAVTCCAEIDCRDKVILSDIQSDGTESLRLVRKETKNKIDQNIEKTADIKTYQISRYLSDVNEKQNMFKGGKKIEEISLVVDPLFGEVSKC